MEKKIKNNTLKEVVATLKKYDDYVLSTHINPDGDGIGSELALGFVLKKMGKKVAISNSDPFPENYTFLPCNGIYKHFSDLKPSYSNAISLECSALDRLGRLKNVFLKSQRIINLDHHLGNDFFGDINYVDSKAAAVGEQVYDIIKDLGIEIDKSIADCIYTSIITDTGSFSYSSTTKRTHQIVTELMDYGVIPSEIYQNVYEVSSVGKIKLLGKALNSLHVDIKHGVAWISLTKKSFKETLTEYGDAEGIINYARSIKGINVAISFTELENDKIKISFRSKSNEIDVNKLALYFKGGGHIRASGATLEGSLKEVQKKVLQKTYETIANIKIPQKRQPARVKNCADFKTDK